MTQSLLDEKAALARMDGDRSLLRQISRMFIARAPGQVESLQSAVIAGNIQEVSRLAHHLRGSLCIFSTPAVTDVATQLEISARHGDLPATVEASRHLERCVTCLLPELEKLAA